MAAATFANPWHDEIGRFAPKGTGTKSDGNEVETSPWPRSAWADKITEEGKANKPNREWHRAFYGSFRNSLEDDFQDDDEYRSERDVWWDYTDWTFLPINRGLRHGNWEDETSNLSPERLQEDAQTLTGMFKVLGRAPVGPLFRGQEVRSNGSGSAVMDLKVGETYVDRGFGSWSMDIDEAKVFAGLDGSGVDRPGTIMKFVNAPETRVIPGTNAEQELITRPDSKFRVTKIIDYVHPTDATKRYRWIEVEGLP